MDVKNFVERLRSGLEHVLGTFEVKILEDKFPTGVKFLVISDEFKDMSRGARMSFLGGHLRSIFGEDYYRTMLAGGIMTCDEFKTFDSEESLSSSSNSSIVSEKKSAHPLIP